MRHIFHLQIYYPISHRHITLIQFCINLALCVTGYILAYINKCNFSFSILTVSDILRIPITHKIQCTSVIAKICICNVATPKIILAEILKTEKVSYSE